MFEHSSIVVGLSLALLVTSLTVLEIRNLKWAILTYMTQALIIVALLIAYASLLPNHALYLWAVTVLVTKATIIPLLLWRYLKQNALEETPPGLGFGSSFLVSAAVMACLYYCFNGRMAWMAPTSALAGEPYATNLAVALTILVFGLYALVFRRDAFKAVISICLIENAVHLSLVSLAPSLPETAMIGVVTDVVLSVWILLIITSGIYRQLGSVDLREMTKLQG